MLAAYRMLEGGESPSPGQFAIDTAQNGDQGLAAVTSRGPYAVIISDMQMPGMNGIEFLGRVRQIAPDSVRIMLTGYAELHVAMDAVNEGNILQFLTKPCTPDKLTRAIVAGINQHRLICAERELLEKTLAGGVQALMEVLSLVNPTAFGRAARIQRLVQQLATALAVEQTWHLEMAATLSQLGCVAVPEDVLRKVRLGAKLSPEESRLFQKHPEVAHAKFGGAGYDGQIATGDV